MYFNGRVSIDPSQLTDLHRMKPTKAFARIGYYLTGGRLSKVEEHETFCALTVLQQLFIVLRSLGIDNVVRLAKDDLDFYHDEEGREGDFKEAIEAFALKVDTIEAEVFRRLRLVLEHSVDDLQCLLEIAVDRIHAPGVDPITIKVNGLMKAFRARRDGDGTDVRRRLEPFFSAQERYDALVMENQTVFQRFLGEIEQAIRKHLAVDAVTVTSDVRIIRPDRRPEAPSAVPHTAAADDPMYHGYYGYDEYVYYGYHWADLCHDHHVNVHDTVVVDAAGDDVFSVGTDGVDAGEGAAFDVDQPFAPPAGTDVQVFGDNQYVEDLDTTKTGAEAVEGSGWLSASADEGGDSGSSSSCSSCSSCGGCGGD